MKTCNKTTPPCAFFMEANEARAAACGMRNVRWERNQKKFEACEHHTPNDQKRFDELRANGGSAAKVNAAKRKELGVNIYNVVDYQKARLVIKDGMTAREAADASGLEIRMIYKVAKKCGVTLSRVRRGIDPDTLAFLASTGLTAKELSEKMGFSKDCIRKKARKLGIEIKRGYENRR